MKRLAKGLLAVAVIGFGIFWWLSAPKLLEVVSSGETREADLASGERLFWAGGCGSCHAEKNAKGDDKLKLGGGHRLDTPFGTFVTPNISPDPETGIGNWTQAQFITAMVSGVSPKGDHYYPAFPYTSYNKMSDIELLDLFAYLKTLPPISRANEPHELALPFQWRRPLGIWKRMFVSQDWAVEVDTDNAKLIEGRYLVEALGHCGECHTPRNFLGGVQTANWLGGGPAPEGDGFIPNITPAGKTVASWSASDLAYYLESGFTPDFDSVGGTMVSVQENMTKLSKEDRDAIAAYLKAVPEVE